MLPAATALSKVLALTPIIYAACSRLMPIGGKEIGKTESDVVEVAAMIGVSATLPNTRIVRRSVPTCLEATTMQITSPNRRA